MTLDIHPIVETLSIDENKSENLSTSVLVANSLFPTAMKPKETYCGFKPGFLFDKSF